jgi:RNA-directed DNA polymerase
VRVLKGSTNEVSMEEIVGNDGSASSHGPNDWQAIDWRRVEQHVRTMQMRIAKATPESGWRKVKALQRSLIRSFTARPLAVRRVTESSTVAEPASG